MAERTELKIEDLIKKYELKTLTARFNPQWKEQKTSKYFDLRLNFTLEQIESANKGDVVVSKNKQGVQITYKMKPSHDVYQVFLKYSDKIFIIDDDDQTETPENIRNEYTFLSKLPYTLSSSKQRPHYFCMIENMPEAFIKDGNKVKVFKKYELDILKFSVERKNSIVHNFIDEIPTIDFSELAPFLYVKTLKTSKPSNSELATIGDVFVFNAEHAKIFISIDGFDSNADWFYIRVLLKSAFGESAREFFHTWSKQSEKYCFESCETEYSRNDFIMEAQKAFNILKSKSNTTGTNNLFEMSEKKYAEWFIENNNNKYKVSNNTFYELNEHNVWIDKCEKSFEKMVFLSNYIEEHLFKPFEKNKKDEFDMFKSIYESNDEELKTLNNSYKNEHKKLVQLKMTIGSTRFCLNVCRQVNELVKDEEFHTKLDRKPHLFAFNDKVFDMSTCEIRDIHPEDYISTTCGYNYPTNGINRDVEAKIREFLKDILNKTSDMFELEHEYGIMDRHEGYDKTDELMLDILASCLYGENMNNHLYIFEGRGANGKSTLQSLIQNTFNNYFKTLGGAYLTASKFSRNGHDSELYACKSARIVCISEIETDCKLKVGFVKQITGDEELTVRELNKSAESFKPQFKAFLIVNDMPEVKLDDGIQRRIVPVEFPFCFKPESDIDPRNNYHKLAKSEMNTLLRSKEYRDTFILMLIEHFKKSFTSSSLKFKIPENVKTTKKNLVEDFDSVIHWIETNYEYTGNQKDFISSKDLYSAYLDTLTDGSQLNYIAFCKKISKSKFPKKSTNTIKGYQCIKKIEK